MENDASGDRPSKRAKTDSQLTDSTVKTDSVMADQANADEAQVNIASSTGVLDDAAKEREVGIIAFVGDSRSVFRGILKKRYTDFLVNEILPDGKVLHLRSVKVKRQAGKTSPDDDDEIPAATESMGQGDKEVLKANSERSAAGGEQSKEAVSNVIEKEEKSESTPATDGSSSEVRLHMNSNEHLELMEKQVSEEDRAKLVGHFNEDTVSHLLSLHQSILRHPDWKSRDHPMVRTEFTSDRTIRSQIHQDIRRIFSSKIDSFTDKDGVLVLTAAAPEAIHGSNKGRNHGWGNNNNNKPHGANFGSSSRPNKLTWQERGGEYLHFSLAKENKDTLEVISYLTKQLKTNTKTFQFAGTKDRRAVTVQRVSAYRIEAERLAGLNRSLRYAAVGDYEYHKQGLELGDLRGNEFVVTLRDCHLEGATIEQNSRDRKWQLQSYLTESLGHLRERGFLNFYGLQRFGTYATRTDVVGVKILKGDFQGACDAILEFSPNALNASSSEVGILVGQDDRARAEGINIYRTTSRINEALDKIPRKFSAETNIIRHLGRHKQDFVGALMGIQRNLRLMYVHAYQSLVWNLAVGERWRLYGDKVVEGDLVLVNEHKDKQTDNFPVPQQGVDADGEVVIEPSGDDRAYEKDDMFERARALTAEEASSGKYSIFDIVLPLPGFDVLYPVNESGTWYKTFMATEAGGELDPYDMRRKQKDFSLSGGYRKVLARIGEDWEMRVEEYADGDGDKQFVETDMDKIKKGEQKDGGTLHSRPQDADGEGTAEVIEDPQNEVKTRVGANAQSRTRLAAVLKFQLGSSQYATMALRELSIGGIQAYKAEFMGGR